jgi:hypothetical protein
MEMPASPEDVSTFFDRRGYSLLVEQRGDAFWASLTRAGTGEVVWPNFGSGRTREEALASAAHRYWVEQRPDLED